MRLPRLLLGHEVSRRTNLDVGFRSHAGPLLPPEPMVALLTHPRRYPGAPRVEAIHPAIAALRSVWVETLFLSTVGALVGHHDAQSSFHVAKLRAFPTVLQFLKNRCPSVPSRAIRHLQF